MNEQTYNTITNELLNYGIVYITGPITDESSIDIISALKWLDLNFKNRIIQLWISSPGGSINAGLAIIDTMNLIDSQIQTVAIGSVASMASVILSSGTKGMRFALPNSEILIHQPLGQLSGQASDIVLHTNNIIDKKNLLNQILAINCNQDILKITKDTERDYIMNSTMALEYGIIDQILIKGKGESYE